MKGQRMAGMIGGVVLMVAAGLATYERPAAQGGVSLQLLGQIGGATQTVAVSGNLAFVARGHVMAVVDVSNKLTPRLLSEIALPSALYHIFATPGRVYAAAGFGGLQIVDVADPAHPRITAAYVLPGSNQVARDVWVEGKLAYVARASGESLLGNQGGIHILDVSDPAKPTEVGAFDAGASTGNLTVAGGTAYLATSAGLIIVDVRDPAKPVKRATVATASTALDHIRSYGGAGVAVSNGIAYVADGYGGVNLIDVKDPARARHVGWYVVPFDEKSSKFTEADKGLGAAFGIAVSGTYVYVAAFNQGMRIVDASNPGRPVEVSHQPTPLWAYQVEVDGGYAYIGDYDGGLRIVDVSNPKAPREVSFYNPEGTGSYRHTEPADDYAYAATGAGGVVVLDVKDPAKPKVAGRGNTPVFSYTVVVSGRYVYCADARSIRVFDAVKPAKPVEVASLPMSGQARTVTVAGRYLYVGDGPRGVAVVDVSDPAHPKEIAVHDTPGNARRIFIQGNTAYIGDELFGLRIVDVSNPASPKELGSWPPSPEQLPPPMRPFVWGAVVKGNHAFVVDGRLGLYVLDVADPKNPKQVAFVKTAPFAWDATIWDRYLFFANSFAGLFIFDISDPAAPKQVAVQDTPGVAWGVRVVDGRVYVIDGVSGLSIFKLVTPGGTAQ